MEVTNRRPSEREEHRAHTSREELVERLVQAVPADGTAEPLAGLRLIRHSAPPPLDESIFRTAWLPGTDREAVAVERPRPTERAAGPVQLPFDGW